MVYLADLHIHSRFSRATSRDCNLPELARWAALKGIRVLATGDFTHPDWNREIQDSLEEAENGLFRLKRQYICDHFQILPGGFGPDEVRFILNVEISSIYKREGSVRKVHSLIFMPDLESVDRFNSRLDRIGNIKSDGRPILGLDCRHLLEIALEASPESFLVPAHVWTPWFSILGSKSGFDSVEECFGELSPYIFALETGLSSDPAMNSMVSALDRYTLISNSDTHSPAKLGREANIFDGQPGYVAIREAIRSGGRNHNENCNDEVVSRDSSGCHATRSSSPNRFLGTLEFFPEEGKYHLDGHRKCSTRLDPSETQRLGGRCPVCGHAVTVGVMNRVNRLADRAAEMTPPRGAPFWRLAPLVEIIAQIMGVGPQSKRVEEAYQKVLARLGPELPILWSHPIETITEHSSAIFVEAIRRVRNGEVFIKAGFDGEYGTVEIFSPEERERLSGQESFFPGENARSRRTPKKITAPPTHRPCLTPTRRPSSPKTPAQPDPEQWSAIAQLEGAVIVQAGPGAGKTLTLANRIRHLVREEIAQPRQITAVTFTRKAATEIQQRLGLERLDQDTSGCWVGTFHQLGMRILDVFRDEGLVEPNYSVISESESLRLFRTATKRCCPGIEPARVAALYDQVSKLKQNLINPTDPVIEPELSVVFSKYDELLSSSNAFDLDDLIAVPVRLMTEYYAQTSAMRSTWARHLLVDEFQDINRAQYEMVRLLVTSGGKGLFVIGDPDQAIYGFRGSNREFFLQFGQDFPSCKPVRLTKNYRSQANIVEGAAAILGNPSGENNVTAERPRSTAIQIVKVPDEDTEAKFIVRTIESLMGGASFLDIDSGGLSVEDRSLGFKDFAVLFRLNAIGDSLEKAFQRASIPFQRAKKTRPEDETDSLDPRAESVALLTIHASKGLEFPVVFLAGCEDGVLPYLRSADRETGSTDFDEELRLLYVAMTRAEKHLFITHAATRSLFGKRRDNVISRFVSNVAHPAFKSERYGFVRSSRRKQDSQQMDLFS